MDDRRFDDLTKFVGHRSSRRAVVKGAAAAALAAAFGRAARGDDTAEAAIYRQGGVKQRVRVYCNQAGQKCKDSKNPTRRCCYKCNGSLSNSNSRCCEAEGFACIVDSHCCNGLICRDPNLSDGVNLKGCFVRGELNPGAECLDDAECTTGICAGGVCCTPNNVCVVDPYDPRSNDCCDPITDICTDDGCCLPENSCKTKEGPKCCDPSSEVCTDVGCCPIDAACDDVCCDLATETCTDQGCCPLEDRCETYTGSECCDPYTAVCTTAGCCPLDAACSDQCCAGQEVCQSGDCCVPSGIDFDCTVDASACCSGQCVDFGGPYEPNCCEPTGEPCDLPNPRMCCSGVCSAADGCL